MAVNASNYFVRVLDEHVDYYRPVDVVSVAEDTFEILDPDKTYDTELECWEFPPGSIVMFRMRKLESGSVLVAVSAT